MKKDRKKQIAKVSMSTSQFEPSIGESMIEDEDGSVDEEMDGGDYDGTSEVSNSFLLLIPSVSSWVSPLTSFVVM